LHHLGVPLCKRLPKPKEEGEEGEENGEEKQESPKGKKKKKKEVKVELKEGEGILFN